MIILFVLGWLMFGFVGLTIIADQWSKDSDLDLGELTSLTILSLVFGPATLAISFVITVVASVFGFISNLAKLFNIKVNWRRTVIKVRS